MNILIKDVKHYKKNIISFDYIIFNNELEIKNELTFKCEFDKILALTDDKEIIQLTKKELVEFINHKNVKVDLSKIENIYYLTKEEAIICSQLIGLKFNSLRHIELQTVYNLLIINDYINASKEIINEFEIIKEFKYRF